MYVGDTAELRRLGDSSLDYDLFSVKLAELDSTRSQTDQVLIQQAFGKLMEEPLDQSQRVIAMINHAAYYLKNGDAEKANSTLALSDPRGVDPTTLAVYYNVKADALQCLSNYKGALEVTERIEELLAPNEIDGEVLSEAHARRGFALAELGRISEAMQAFEQAEGLAIAKDVRFSIALYRSYCLDKIGDPLGALKVLDDLDASQSVNTSREVQYAKGRLYLKLQRVGPARECLLLASTLQSDGSTRLQDVKELLDRLPE